MNFTDLYKKIAALENLEPSDKYTHKDLDDDVAEDNMPQATSNVDQPLMGSQMADLEVEPIADPVAVDTDMEECGGMMSSPMMSPKQPDNVSMTVNMNGSGKGGIRDLLDVLKNIEQSAGGDKAMVIGMEEFANQPNATVADTSAMTPTGDDLSSKGAEAEKVNGGGNPMQPGVSESLVSHLNNLYQEIKSRN